MAEAANFPDILGFITAGERLDLGSVQAAAATLPAVIKAGKSFRVVVVLQNMVDSPIEMLVGLNMPADAGGKKNKFSAKTLRISVGMQPGEVGMILLPVASLSDSAPGAVRFPISINDVKATERGGRIRTPDGGSELYLSGLKRETRKLIENLSKQKFVGGKKSVLTGTASLEPAVTFQVGSLAEISDLKPEYRTIWTRAELREDPLVLLERFKDDLSQHALIALDRTLILTPLTEKTTARFKQAGYPLTEVEAKLIGRALTHILEYACTGQFSYGRTYLPMLDYEVLPLIQQEIRDRKPITLHWLTAVLYAIAEDNRVPKYMPRTLVKDPVYDALLRDCLVWALNTVEAATGLELGTPDELNQHANQWFEKFQRCAASEADAEALTIEDVYLPLVLAGIVIYDELTLPQEDIKTFNPLFQVMLRERADERTAENSSLFEITTTLLDKALKKYGLGLL